MAEPPLRSDELRVLRQMMSEYTQDRAVGRWLTAKWRAVVVVFGAVSAVAVLTASIIQITKAVV